MDRLMEAKPWKKVDWWLLGAVVALCVVGFIAITYATADPFTGGEATFSEKLTNLNLDTVKKQVLWFGVGLVAMAFMALLDYTALKDISVWIYGVNAVILLALFSLATVTRQTVSWYKFGNIGFQPSEICKLSLILYLGKILCDNIRGEQGIQYFTDALKPLVVTGIVFVLVMLQPDMGTAAVYVSICIGMMFVVGVGWKIVATLGASALAIAPLMWFFVLDDRQRNRIITTLNPSADIGNTGYNVHYSKMAIGSGGVTGKGMFSEGALSQLNWVPEKHTDFIFSAIGEAFGLIGGLTVILLYGLLIWRIIYIGMNAQNQYGTLICAGVASMFMFHIFENIGMTMGIMPVTGIPLPFISYGGSSMLTNMLAVGLVMGVKARTRKIY